MAQENSEHSERRPVSPPLGNIYLFDILNSVSWNVVMGVPMILYFQHLNASATIIALAASLTPVSNVLQIPAAHHVERIGYRRLVLSGWTARSFLVIAMAVLAFFSTRVTAALAIWIMLGLSVGYNLLRGISACALMPWFMHLVPEHKRGEFVARDQAGVAGAGLLCLLFCSTLFSLIQSALSFGFVFLLSAAAGFASLIFLRRIPDVPTGPGMAPTSPVPWREIISYGPFARYLGYTVLVNLTLGAAAVFWVRYFRTSLHVSESKVLVVACATNGLLVLTLLLLASLADRVGAKRLLTFSGILFILHFIGWAMVAGRFLPFGYAVLLVQVTTLGAGTALWSLANIRCIMNIVPKTGRAHFLALYSFTGGITYGLSPLLWGPILDRLAHWEWAWARWHWNSFSLFYLVLTGTMLAAIAMLPLIAETKFAIHPFDAANGGINKDSPPEILEEIL